MFQNNYKFMVYYGRRNPPKLIFIFKVKLYNIVWFQSFFINTYIINKKKMMETRLYFTKKLRVPNYIILV